MTFHCFSVYFRRSKRFPEKDSLKSFHCPKKSKQKTDICETGNDVVEVINLVESESLISNSSDSVSSEVTNDASECAKDNSVSGQKSAPDCSKLKNENATPGSPADNRKAKGCTDTSDRILVDGAKGKGCLSNFKESDCKAADQIFVASPALAGQHESIQCSNGTKNDLVIFEADIHSAETECDPNGVTSADSRHQNLHENLQPVRKRVSSGYEIFYCTPKSFTDRKFQ